MGGGRAVEIGLNEILCKMRTGEEVIFSKYVDFLSWMVHVELTQTLLGAFCKALFDKIWFAEKVQSKSATRKAEKCLARNIVR